MINPFVLQEVLNNLGVWICAYLKLMNLQLIIYMQLLTCS